MRFLVIAVTLTMLAAPALAADNTVYLKEIDDLPLPAGFVEQPGGTEFDAPTGRIVEATAQGHGLEVEIAQFYDATLPELGWNRVSDSTYARDKEVLHVDTSISGMNVTVHFSLAPVKQAEQPADKADKADKAEKEAK